MRIKGAFPVRWAPQDGKDSLTHYILITKAVAYVDKDGKVHLELKWKVFRNEGGVDYPVSVDDGSHQFRLFNGSWENAGDDGSYELDSDGYYNGDTYTTLGSPAGVEIRYFKNGQTKATANVSFSVYGQKGEGATYIELDNDNASMLYDGLGNIVGGVNGYLYSLCHLYHNGQEVTTINNNPVFFTIHEKSSTVTATITNNNTIKVTAITSDTGYVTVKTTLNGEPYYKTMNLKRIVGSDKYEIEPNFSAISYNTSTGVANTNQLQVKVYRTVQNGQRTNLGSLPSGFTLNCTNATQIAAYGASGHSYAVFQINDWSVNDVIFSLIKSGVTLDEESVPINKFANGTSVLAQFSVGDDGNGNWNWHSPFVTGDIWMRTSENGGTSWSDAMRIVGESGANGAYTDYKFAISAALSTASIYTAPAISGSWSDAPSTPTTQYPYTWMRVQKYNGNGTTNGLPKYIRITGEKGQNGTSVSIKGRVDDYIASIPAGTSHIDMPVYATDTPSGVTRWDENEHDWVETTPSVGDGYLVNDLYGNKFSDQYQGHLIVYNSNGWIDAGVIKGDAGAPSYLHIAYANSADGSVDFTTDDSEADGHAYIGTYVDNNITDSELYSDYNWVRVRGENGIVYDIVPSVFNIHADANGTVSTGAIEVSAYKTDGETRSSNLVTALQIIGSEYYYVQFSIDGGVWTNCSQISVGAGLQAQIAYGVPLNKVRTATVGIAFRLKHSSNNNKVLKTIPAIQVVKDGGQGIQGIEGCIIRKTQWQTGINYCNDKNDTTKAYRYIDIAIIQGSTPTSFEAFMCRVSHLSTLENAPVSGQTTTEWEKLGVTTPMYTPLLLADYASITFAQTNRILVMKADGETVAAGMGGAEGGNTDYPLWVGATYQERASAPFRVNLQGKLFATDADISGKIKATSGEIAGFKISSLNITTSEAYYKENKRGLKLSAYSESQIGCLTTRHNTNDDGINIHGWLTVEDQVQIMGMLYLYSGLRVKQGGYTSGQTLNAADVISTLSPTDNDQTFYLPSTYSDAQPRFLFLVNLTDYHVWIQKNGSSSAKIRWKGTQYNKFRLGSKTSVILVYLGGCWELLNMDNDVGSFTN